MLVKVGVRGCSRHWWGAHVKRTWASHGWQLAGHECTVGNESHPSLSPQVPSLPDEAPRRTGGFCQSQWTTQEPCRSRTSAGRTLAATQALVLVRRPAEQHVCLWTHCEACPLGCYGMALFKGGCALQISSVPSIKPQHNSSAPRGHDVVVRRL